MDHKLKVRLQAIDKKIDQLKEVEEKYLTCEASEDATYAILYMQTKGTVAERQAMVHKSDEWKIFQNGLVAAKVDYNMQKRKLELQLKAFDAEYLSFKIENSVINRQSSQT